MRRTLNAPESSLLKDLDVFIPSKASEILKFICGRLAYDRLKIVFSI
jgi:hypothetical protein